jgi:F0F1-type ATP synthase membrane subunit b/b'
MIKTLLFIFIVSLFLWFAFGRKMMKKYRKKRELEIQKEMEAAAFDKGYLAERLKIAMEQGKEAARDEQENKKINI